MKRTFALAVLAVICLIVVSIFSWASAYADDSIGCIEITEAPGYPVLVNNCTTAVNVHWCVDTASGSQKCSSLEQNNGVGGSAATLRQNSQASLDGYKGSNGVYWAACFAPLTPRNWKGRGSTYGCR